jgi:phage shock protein PspC (stress-responsive transcriptional regulator)
MDLADQLQKLQALKEQGALSEEEFTLAKRRVLDGMPPVSGADRNAVPPPTPSGSTLHQLKRSITDRWIGGVCGGLAAMTNMPSWAWRVLFILTALLHGIGILVYLVLWIFVPLQTMPPSTVREEPKTV